MKAIIVLVVFSVAATTYWASGRTDAKSELVTQTTAHRSARIDDSTVMKDAAPETVRELVSPTNRISIPSIFQLAGIREVAVANSWTGLISRYSDVDRATINTFVGGLAPVAYLFHSEEELAWMAERGFPMPDDILAAATMSDADLLEMSLQGNAKAALLYQARDLDLERRGLQAASKEEAVAQMRVRGLAYASNSPFLGYLEAKRKAKIYPGDPSPSAGALAWAQLKGDTRAQWSMARDRVDAGTMTATLAGLLNDEAFLRKGGWSYGAPQTKAPVELSIPQNEETLQAAWQLARPTR